MSRLLVISAALVTSLVTSLTGSLAFAQTANLDTATIEQGRYLATAADCAACHGDQFSGGKAIASPIGNIFASNITPHQATGIGSWSLQQFSDALRKGKTPDEHLYPAMPYTSYTGLTDAQVGALYAYFMHGVQPVSHTPQETRLPFPFYRPMMAFWNTLFLDVGQSTGAVKVSGAAQERGRVLVETLGHCTACHTPRAALMQQNSKRHLAGAMVDGWWAPNITPDKTGIGDWSDEQLATFLMTGHTDVAVAAGEMGTAVRRSLSQLSKPDIDTVVAYLRAVPAVVSTEPVHPPRSAPPTMQVSAIEPGGETQWQGMLTHNGAQGNLLYQNARASCHGLNGAGSTDLKHPSLLRVASVRGPDSATLVQVIAHGVDRKVGDDHVLMPPFANDMNSAQIAAVASYVRTAFGGVQGAVNDAQVKKILAGRVQQSWLIQNAAWLAVVAVVLALLVLVVIARRIFQMTRRRRSRTAQAS